MGTTIASVASVLAQTQKVTAAPCISSLFLSPPSTTLGPCMLLAGLSKSRLAGSFQSHLARLRTLLSGREPRSRLGPTVPPGKSLPEINPDPNPEGQMVEGGSGSKIAGGGELMEREKAM